MPPFQPAVRESPGMTNGSYNNNARHSMPPPPSVPYQQQRGATNLPPRPLSYANTLPPGTAPPSGGHQAQRSNSMDKKDGKPPIPPRSDKDKKHHRGVLGSIFKKKREKDKSDK